MVSSRLSHQSANSDISLPSASTMTFQTSRDSASATATATAT